jgi:hypothetical protein
LIGIEIGIGRWRKIEKVLELFVSDLNMILIGGRVLIGIVGMVLVVVTVEVEIEIEIGIRFIGRRVFVEVRGGSFRRVFDRRGIDRGGKGVYRRGGED